MQRCGKLGHIKPVCRSKKSTNKDDYFKKKHVHHVQGDTPESSDQVTLLESVEYEELFNVPSSSHLKPCTTTLQVERQPLTMEIDTGASVSLVSDDTRRPIKRMQPSMVKLTTYSGEALPVRGTFW